MSLVPYVIEQTSRESVHTTSTQDFKRQNHFSGRRSQRCFKQA